MSVCTNLWNDKNICLTSDNLFKKLENGKVFSSKIRKFYFLLQDKQIERDLRVTIYVITGEKLSEQNILLELTNDVNPIFLFVLCITQNDFDTLRENQGLNIDFKDFPEALLRLFDQCIDSVSENGGRYKLMLKDYCGTAAGGRIMDMNKIQIQVIEECAFRNICHLTLDIVRGTELQIRQKLEMEVWKTKQALLKTSKLHDEALVKISELVEELNGKTHNIDNLNCEINEMKVHREEENEIKRVHVETQEKQLRSECEDKISHEREQFQSQLNLMQNKIDTLESELKSKHEERLQMQSDINAKEREKELNEVELISKKQEVYQLRSQNEKLDSDYHDKEKAVNILRTRLAVAEQELRDKNAVLTVNEHKVEEIYQEKNNIQKNLELIKKILEKKENVVLNLSEEILKANEIISKHQSRINTLSTKLSERDETFLKQEKLLNEKEESLARQNKMVKHLQETISNSAERLLEFSKNISSLENNLQSAHEKLANKSKTVVKLKETLKGMGVQSHFSKSPLLFYRTFLSLPSLLPSDECRRTDEIWDLLLDDHVTTDDSFIGRKLSSSANKVITPYLYRYLKRYQSIPLQLFKCPDIPVNVLLLRDGLCAVQDFSYPSVLKKHQPILKEDEKIICYPTVSKTAGSHYSLGTKSQSTIQYLNKDRRVQNVSNYLLDTNCTEKNKSVGLVAVRSRSPLHEPTEESRLKTNGNSNKFSLNGHQTKKKKSKNDESKNIFTSNFRKMPAVSAPPLTPEQRHSKESIVGCQRKKLPIGPLLHSVQGSRVQVVNSRNCSQQLRSLWRPEVIHEVSSSETIVSVPQPNSKSVKAINENVLSLKANTKLHEGTEPSAYFIT